MANIIRPMNDRDSQFIEVDLNKPKSKKGAREAFQIALGKKEKECNKKGIPFARHVARDDFDSSLRTQRETQLRENGEVDTTLIKAPKIDLDKYCDLTNFKVVDDSQRRDTELSKQHRMPIWLKTKVYKYKGYGNKYVVMEDADMAVERAHREDVESKPKPESKS